MNIGEANCANNVKLNFFFSFFILIPTLEINSRLLNIYCLVRRSLSDKWFNSVLLCIQGLVTLCGMLDAAGKPVLLCACNNNVIRVYDLPS